MKLPKGFGFPGGGIGDLIKQAQAAMEGAKKIEEQLAHERIETKIGPVQTAFSGTGEPLSLKIDPTGLNIKTDELEMLEDVILSAVREGISKANDLKASRLKTVMPNIPGM